MNERIKKLIAQADKLSLQYANKNNINFVDAFNIVFAELIVRECHNYFYDDDVLFNGVDGLLAHFGIEE